MQHQQFIEHVANAALLRLPEAERGRLAAKITYGAGKPGLRGVTYYDVWQSGESDVVPLVEICAFGEQDKTQLAGTTLHELAHVLAGSGAGHSKAWKHACERLGLRRAMAAGTHYQLANFAPDMRWVIAALPEPVDGRPNVAASAGAGGAMTVAPYRASQGAKPCTLGFGTRGGKSRGVGSGSRLRKYVCGHGQIIRASTDDLNVSCNVCGEPFERA